MEWPFVVVFVLQRMFARLIDPGRDDFSLRRLERDFWRAHPQ